MSHILVCETNSKKEALQELKKYKVIVYVKKETILHKAKELNQCPNYEIQDIYFGFATTEIFNNWEKDLYSWGRDYIVIKKEFKSPLWIDAILLITAFALYFVAIAGCFEMQNYKLGIGLSLITITPLALKIVESDERRKIK